MSDEELIKNCPTPEYHETHRYCPSCPWTDETYKAPPTFDDAVAAIKAQADLPSMVYFESPSDFRKGVMSCLAALEALKGERL